MPLTLLEMAKRSDANVVMQAVIQTYAETSDILRVLPFQNIDGGAMKYQQEHALPGVGFRGVNAGYTESTGVLNPVVEPLVIAGGDLDVDKFMVRTIGPDFRTQQEMMKVKALAHRWTNAFIKGDSTGVGSAEFDGLQTRIVGSQLIPAGATSGGDALSLGVLDAAIDQVDGPNALLMSRSMRRRLQAAARTTSVSGFINWTLDAFGRRVTMYNDLPILIADGLGDAYATLAYNEANPGGGANVGTSIYVLSLGDGMLTGIQNGDPEVTDLGEIESKPVMRTRVEWYNGIAVFHPRAAARIWGIKDAAIVA